MACISHIFKFHRQERLRLESKYSEHAEIITERVNLAISMQNEQGDLVPTQSLKKEI